MSEPLYLRISEPGRAGYNVPIRQSMTVGRSKKNLCRLNDETVSREHAVLVETRDGWMIMNIAKDNAIRLVQGGKDQLLEEFKNFPLTEGMSLELGKVKCEVTRDPGVPKRDSAGFRSRSWLFRSRSSVSRGTGQAPLPRNDSARVVDITPQGLASGRGSGRKEAVEKEARSQDTKAGLIVGEGKLKSEPWGQERGKVESGSATNPSNKHSETLELPTDESVVKGLSGIEAINPRLLILKEGQEELVVLKDRLQQNGDRFECMLGRTPAGRARGRVTIGDESVGREHARIEFKEKAFTITDNRSRSGIAIAGRRDLPIYKVLQPPERIPPGVPLTLSPDMHLRIGLVHVIFLADLDERGQKVNFDDYKRAWNLLRKHLTRQQRKRVLAKTREERAPHYGAILLLDGLVTTEVWFKHLFYALIYPPPEPGFFRRVLERFPRLFRLEDR